MIATYLCYSTVVSLVMLNYNALQAEMTLDYNERTSLSSFRIFFSTVASILAALLPLEIVKAFPDVRQGYIAMGLVFGAIFALADDRVGYRGAGAQGVPEAARVRSTCAPPSIDPFRARTFVLALLMYLFVFVAMDAVSSIVVFFMRYHMLRGAEANYVAGTLLIFQVISLPFYVLFSKRTSKRFALMSAARSGQPPC